MQQAPLSKSTDEQARISSLMQQDAPLQMQKAFTHGWSKYAKSDSGASSLSNVMSTSTASSSKSDYLYEDRVRALLKEGIKVSLLFIASLWEVIVFILFLQSRLYYCASSQYLQGQIYLSKTKKATYHVSAYWKDKKPLKRGDSVIIKMRLGEKLTYTKDKLGVGASLEISKGQFSYPIFIKSGSGKGAQNIREIIESRSSM